MAGLKSHGGRFKNRGGGGACRAPGSRAEGLGFKSEAGVGKLAGLKAEVAGIFGCRLQIIWIMNIEKII